jgi:hypothetical protein
MKKLTLILLICSISLNLFSQEIDFGKVHEDTKSENVLTGVILKIGANTFLNSGTPNYLKDKAYDMYDYNYADPIKLNSNQGISTFDNNSELTEIEYSKCYGVNSSIGYKTKLRNKLYFSIEGCYNFTRRTAKYHRDGKTIQSVFSMNSISLPTSFSIQINKKLDFEIGVNIRYNFYKRQRIDNSNWVENPNLFSKSSVSPFVGINYNITRRLFIHARYLIGDKVIFTDRYREYLYHNGFSNIEQIIERNVYLPSRIVFNQLQFSIGFNI